MKKLLAVLGFLFFSLAASAQIEDPVDWSFYSEKINEKEAYLVLKASIEPGWHVYSQFIKEGGPVPTSFKFSKSADYVLVGKVTESPKAVSAFDKNFDMTISWHENEVIFKQRITLNRATEVTGTLEFMVCNDRKCLPPAEEEFSIKVGGALATTQPVSVKDTGTKKSILQNRGPSKAVIASQTSSQTSFWGIFLAGFIGGLAAFFIIR